MHATHIYVFAQRIHDKKQIQDRRTNWGFIRTSRLYDDTTQTVSCCLGNWFVIRLSAPSNISQKRSVAKTLLQRAVSLPSNSDSQANEREYVLNVLRENNYPKRFLNDCLRSPVCRNQNNSECDTSVKGYAIVSYIQGVTEPIKRILSNCNNKVALKPSWTWSIDWKILLKQIRKLMLYILYTMRWLRKRVFRSV
jgi:hypothetical protein